MYSATVSIVEVRLKVQHLGFIRSFFRDAAANAPMSQNKISGPLTPRACGETSTCMRKRKTTSTPLEKSVPSVYSNKMMMMPLFVVAETINSLPYIPIWVSHMLDSVLPPRESCSCLILLCYLPTATATRPRGAHTENPRGLTPTDPTTTVTHELQQAPSVTVFLAFSRFSFSRLALHAKGSASTSTAGKERVCEVVCGTDADEEDDLFVLNDTIEGSDQRFREGVSIESSFPGESLRGSRERER